METCLKRKIVLDSTNSYNLTCIETLNKAESVKRETESYLLSHR